MKDQQTYVKFKLTDAIISQQLLWRWTGVFTKLAQSYQEEQLKCIMSGDLINSEYIKEGSKAAWGKSY